MRQSVKRSNKNTLIVNKYYNYLIVYLHPQQLLNHLQV